MAHWTSHLPPDGKISISYSETANPIIPAGGVAPNHGLYPGVVENLGLQEWIREY